MSTRRLALSSWTPEQVALGRRRVNAWKAAESELERLRRKELRELDAQRAMRIKRPRSVRWALGKRLTCS